MKNTSRKPYLYKVTNFVTGQYYIGSQCRGKIIGKNYFTSSTNKEFWEDFKTYGEEKYKIEIIKEFDDPKKCGRAENYMIRNHMLKKDGLCLNRACCCSGKKIFSRVGTHGWNKGTHRTEEERQKRSIALKGRPSPFKGIHHTEEAKEKISRNSSKRINISIGDNTFDSLAEAAKYYNVTYQTIRYWTKTKKHNAVYIEK